MITKALSALEAEQSPICAFADDIGGLAGEAEELTNLVERLDEISVSLVGSEMCIRDRP